MMRPFYHAVLSVIALLSLFSNFSSLFAQTAVPTGHNFGYTPGQFAVSDAGAATYQLPFVLPLGTAGLQPRVGLSYSSQNSNGTVGLGWMVTGLSSISRSTRTRAQDETADAAQQTKSVATGITYDKNDRFSLDGERLVLAPQSVPPAQAFDANYGNDQTQYYTEQNSFTKVVLTENAGTQSPQFFKTYTKSGLIFEYGNTTDSRVMSSSPSGQSVGIQWLVNRIEDRKGNYMTFSYLRDATTGEVYPDKIEYTGNTGASVTPYNKIQFVYETRPDPILLYGIRYQQKNTYTKRLRSVQVYYQTTLIREYLLSYQFDQYSLLTQITETDGSSPVQTFNPTTFEWSNKTIGLGTPAEVTTTNIGTNRLFGDFNGDGLTDITTWTTAGTIVTIQFYLNNGDRSFVTSISRAVDLGGGGGTNLRLDVGELNGDALNDIIVTFQPNTAGANSYAFVLSDPVSAQPYSCNYYVKLGKVGASVWDDYLTDLNHDGLTDFVDLSFPGNVPTLSAAHVAQTLPTNNATVQTYYQSVQAASLTGYNNTLNFSSPEEVFNDLNGDGLTDILIYDKASGNNVIVWTEAQRTVADAATRKNQFQSQQTRYDRSSSIPASWLAGAANTVLLADCNADDLPDLLVYKPAAGQVFLYPNQGGYPHSSGVAYLFGTAPTTVQPVSLALSETLPSSFTGIYPNDFNADGLLDLTFFDASEGHNHTFINKGNFNFNVTTTLYDAWPTAMFKAANQFRVGQFLKGSHADLYYFDAAANKYYLQRLRQSEGYSLKRVTNGAGLSVEVSYDNMLNSALYERAGLVTFPNIDVQSPLYVVAKIKTRTSTGDETAKTYWYCGATINTEGRGFRGFVKTIERDTITGIYESRHYRQDADNFKYTGQTLTRTERYYPNGVLIAKTEIFPTLINYPATNPTSFAAYDQRTITSDYVNGKTQTVRKAHDDWGNPIYVTVDYGSSLRDSTVSTYTNDAANWILGRLTTATLYRYAPGQPTITRQSSFTYDAATGLLTGELADANLNNQQQVRKTYTYDAAGNVTRSETTAWTGTAFDTRTMLSEYDAATKRFAVKVTNPLGQTATTAYDLRFGLPTVITDPNGLTSTTEYDGFSRPTRQTGPDGTWRTMAYWKASTANYQSPAEAVFLTYTKTSAGQESIEHFDSYNRAVQTKSRSFDGRWIVVDHTFDRVTSPEYREKIQDSFPYYANESSTGYSEKQLDNLGRPIAVSESKTGGVRTANTVYGGLVTEQFNYKNQKKTEVEDTKDRLVQSSWQNGQHVYYTYDAADRLLTVKDQRGNTITNEYDARGYKIRMTDPDMGTYRYEYNGFGELTKQTYPSGKEVRMEYDRLGRLTKRTEDEGVTTYAFDQGNKAIGRLSSVTGYVSNQTFTYDNLGRKSQETLTVNGQNYATAYVYDSQSRVERVTYPSSGLVLKHVYNAYGHLSELRNNADNSLFWKVITMDAKSDVTQQEFGNGVRTEQQYEAATNYLQRIKSTYNGAVLQEFAFQFNDLGHLMERQDVKRSKRESFDYDDINRLTLTYLNGTARDTVRYDDLGNITYKSGVGLYEYGSANNGPHRLLNVRSNNPGLACSITLDITTEFTSFNKVRRIANDTSYAEIYYGPDQQRVMQKLFVRGTLTRTKIYVGGLVEIESFATGRTKTTSYIGGAGIVVRETQGASTTVTTKYYLKDHLGSVTGFTGAGGVLLEEMSFDAWGQRRNADWTALAGRFAGSHERGFTDHEHYDLFSLIDMNGRVYDPMLGRFLSPDPFIQDMTDLQSLNRYSYTNNNPLSYVDPSGYGWLSKAWKKIKKVVKAVWKPVVITAVAVVTGGIGGPLLAGAIGLQAGGLGAIIVSGAAAGFASNATGTLLNGGGLGDALKSGLKGAVIGGVSAGLTYGVGDLAETALNGKEFAQATLAEQAAHIGIKAVGHGVVQGSMTELQGGKFIQGFASGAVSGAAGPFINQLSDYSARIATSAIAGGTASSLAGGSFTNGAISGAFVQMYNEEQIHKTYEYNGKRDLSKLGLAWEILKNRTATQFGFGEAGEIATIGMTWDIIPKSFIMEGASGTTSLASSIILRTGDIRIGSIRSPVGYPLTDSFKMRASPGLLRAGARWAGWVGVGLTAFDVGVIGGSTYEEYNQTVNQNR
ncbi:RHS repeat-associated core domain-containing protein [Spirosoma arcticum]